MSEVGERLIKAAKEASGIAAAMGYHDGWRYRVWQGVTGRWVAECKREPFQFQGAPVHRFGMVAVVKVSFQIHIDDLEIQVVGDIPGCLFAYSDDMPGLYAHGRTRAELEGRMRVAIKALRDARADTCMLS